MGNRICHILSVVALVVLLTGCGAVAPANHPATMAAENRGFVTEAAQIRATLSVQETQVLATSVAAETTVARENIVNALILQTVQAGSPPTVQVVAQLDRSVGASAMAMMEDGEGAMTLENAFGEEPSGAVVTTYTSTELNQGTGCGVDQTFQFPTGTHTVYAVQEVEDIEANTLIGIEWYYGGSVAFADNLLVPQAEDYLCIWFFLEPYSQGSWSVQFSSNGTPVGDRVNFLVGE